MGNDMEAQKETGKGIHGEETFALAKAKRGKARQFKTHLLNVIEQWEVKACLEVWLNLWGTLQVRQMNLDLVIPKFAHSKLTRRMILVIHASLLSPSGSD